MDSRDNERKVGMFVLGVLVLFAVLFLRLGELQLVQGHVYEELSQGNRLRLLTVFASRGEIYDRHGELLAGNRPAFAVSLLHMGVDEMDRTLPLLGELLDMDPAEIKRRVDNQRGRWYEPIKLRTDVPPELHVLVEEHRHDLPGMVIEPLPVREYPHGSVAAHVLGHLGEIEARTLERLAEYGYRSGDTMGQLGIEAVYDRYLRGTDGGRQVEVDARGRPYRTMGQIDPIQGNNVHLTIDLGLQIATEQALIQVMTDLQNHPTDPTPGARTGAAVAIDPRTGEILAMASHPTYDPGLFATRISVADWNMLQSDPLQPLLNRTVLGEYQPGSAFKMVVAAAGLETGRTFRHEVFDPCTGFYHITPTDFKRCWAARHGGHGRLNLVDALGQSCNVVFYELGRRVGVDDIGTYVREFGLGSATGLQDLTAEREGLVPSRAWKRENFPHDPQWWLSETLDVAIGQGFNLYTPLQMAVYASIMANGGIHYRPHLVSRVASPDGEVLLEVLPEELRRADVSPATLEVLKEGMIKTTSPGGTAFRAFDGFPLTVPGKTGTVELVGHDRDDHGWFVCYAPADNPRIAIAVIVEHGGGGARAAAPVARLMLEQFFGVAVPGVPELEGSE